MKVVDPQAFADLFRVIDLVVSCLAAGCLGYSLVMFTRAFQKQLRPDTNLLIAYLFAASYWLLLLAGIASDINRIHQPLTLYLPLHLAGAGLSIPVLIIGALAERRRLQSLDRSRVKG